MDVEAVVELLAWFARLDNHNCAEVALHARAQIHALRAAAEETPPNEVLAC